MSDPVNYARGERDGFEHHPVAYAKRLASYLRDPSTIRARTRDFFGRAPSLDIITALMAEQQRPAPERRDMAEDRDWPEDDGSDWRPRGLVTPIPSSPAHEPKAITAVEVERINALPLPLTPGAIIAAVAATYGVTTADLIGKSRRRVFSFPRMAAAYVLIQRGNSASQVGRFLGGRDHSTILHAGKQFKAKATERDWEIVRRFFKAPAA